MVYIEESSVSQGECMTYRKRGGLFGMSALLGVANQAGSPGFAAEDEAATKPASELEASEVVEIVVTGSRIPTAIDKVAAKVSIVDAQEIEKAGYTYV
jgi:outer membrane cobalamin receptor